MTAPVMAPVPRQSRSICSEYSGLSGKTLVQVGLMATYGTHMVINLADLHENYPQIITSYVALLGLSFFTHHDVWSEMINFEAGKSFFAEKQEKPLQESEICEAGTQYRRNGVEIPRKTKEKTYTTHSAKERMA